MAVEHDLDTNGARDLRSRRRQRSGGREERPSVVITPPPLPPYGGGGYDPIAPSWRERVRGGLQYYGFGVGLLLLALSLTALAFYTLVLPELRPDEADPLAELMDPAVRDRALSSIPPVAPEGPAADLVSVHIGSFPPGAAVLVNNDPAGFSPIQDLRLRPGYHLITLSLAGHARRDTLVEVTSGAGLSLTFALRALEDVLGTTDAAPSLPRASGTPPTQQRAQQRQPPSARQPVATRESREAAAPRTSAPEPVRTGGIAVISDPSDAEVLLDSQPVGRTPLTLRDLQPGLYQITVRKPGFSPSTRGVRVASGNDTSADFSLQQQEGRVAILVRPWGSIYIDGVLVKRDTDVQHTASLSPGAHSIQIRHPVLGVRERTVQIQPNETTRVIFDLATDN